MNQFSNIELRKNGFSLGKYTEIRASTYQNVSLAVFREIDNRTMDVAEGDKAPHRLMSNYCIVIRSTSHRLLSVLRSGGL